jgi:hypothetical protein
MNPTSERSLLAAVMVCAMGACFTLRAAHAETPLGVHSMAEAKADFEHDRAACRNHTVDEDKKTCMLEANRAYAQARREVMHPVAANEQTPDTTVSSSGTSSERAPRADRN